MYALADYYGISGLQILALHKFRDAAWKYWDCPEFTQILELICKIQLSVDTMFLGTVMDVIRMRPSLLDKLEIAVVLCKASEFTFALLRQVIKRPGR
jgi:hypothetical protein